MITFTTTRFQKLVGYQWHITQRLLDAPAKLDTAASQADPGYGRGSMHNVFVHLLNTDRGYRVGLETGQRPPPLDPASLPDLAALQAAFAQEQTAWHTLLDGLSADEIEGQLSITVRPGQSFPMPRWHML